MGKKAASLMIILAMCLSMITVSAAQTVSVTATADYDSTAKAVTISGMATSAQVVVIITHSSSTTPDFFGPSDVVDGSYSIVVKWTTKPANDYTVKVQNQDDYTFAEASFSTIRRNTVTFDSQGGSAVAPKIAVYDKAITAPAVPTMTGYTFDGWYKESGYINEWIFATDKVTADLTLYARWSINSYTISFNSLGGSQVAAKTADYDTVIALPAAPTRSGYIFVGWYSDTACTSPWIFASSKITASRTLYAKWIAAAVTGLKALTYTYNSIKLTWTATPGASHYLIYRATSAAGAYSLVTTQSAASATYINTGLATGTTYYYKVRAYAMIGTAKIYSGYSSYTYTKAIPATPVGLKAVSASYNSIKLTWTAVTGANGYTVYRSTSSTGTYSPLTTITANYYTNTGLPTGSTYYYQVSAYRLVGTTKVYGARCAAIGKRVVPPAITSLTAARYSATSIKISWGAISGANGYEIYRAASSAGTYSMIKSQTALSYINTALKTGTTYYYKVRSYRMAGTTKVYSDFSPIKYAKP